MLLKQLERYQNNNAFGVIVQKKRVHTFILVSFSLLYRSCHIVDIIQQIAAIEVGLLIVIGAFWIFLYFYLGYEKKKAPPVPEFYPGLTIAVPVHNEVETIEKNLIKILNADYDNIEIIVVNDGSTDGTDDVLKKFEDKVKIITLEENQGKANALNLAIKEAQNEIFVTVDADSMIEPDSLKHIVRHFYNPRVGAVAGFVKIDNSETLFSRIQDLEYLQCFFQREIQDLVNSVTITPGPLSAYRKDVLEQLGGFQSDTLVEDFDLCIRIHKLGYFVRSDSESVVKTVAPNIFGWWRQRTRWFRGGIQLVRKHADVIFNQEYEFLGMVMFPMAIFWLFVPVIAMPTIVLNSLPKKIAIDGLSSNISLAGIKIFIMANISQQVSNFFSVGEFNFLRFLILLSTLIGITYIYLSIRVSKESLRRYIITFPVIGLYSFLLLTVCLKSVLQEIFFPDNKSW